MPVGIALHQHLLLETQDPYTFNRTPNKPHHVDRTDNSSSHHPWERNTPKTDDRRLCRATSNRPHARARPLPLSPTFLCVHPPFISFLLRPHLPFERQAVLLQVWVTLANHWSTSQLLCSLQSALLCSGVCGCVCGRHGGVEGWRDQWYGSPLLCGMPHDTVCSV